MNMEIERIEPGRNISDHQQSGSNTMKLSTGDVFVCQVMEKQVNSIALKSEDGNIFVAKLVGDIGIAVGDNVEIIVNHLEKGRYTLQVLDIHTKSNGQKSGQTSNDNKNNLAETFMQNNEKSARHLLDTLTMLKRNPNIDPRKASFISKSNISDTTENIKIITQLVNGDEKMSSVLMDILSGVQSYFNKTLGDSQVNASVPVDINGPTGTIIEAKNDAGIRQEPEISDNNMPKADVSAKPNSIIKGVPNDAGVRQEPEISDNNMPKADVSAKPNSITNGVPKNTMSTHAENTIIDAPKTDMPHKEQALPQQRNHIEGAEKPLEINESGILKEYEMDPGKNNLQDANSSAIKTDTNTAEEKTANKYTNDPLVKTGDDSKMDIQKSIINKISEMFCLLDDTKKIGTEIQNVVCNMPDKLKELKLLLNRYDNEDKDAYMQKVDQLEKQIMLMSGIKRFACLQFPYTRKGQTEKTAEIFVYRYKRKKQEADKETFLILMGLDTQNIGRVETLIKANQEKISLLFRLEDNNTLKRIMSDKKQLRQAIEHTGHQLTDIKTIKLDKKITVLNAEEFLLQQAKVESGNVDVRI